MKRFHRGNAKLPKASFWLVGILVLAVLFSGGSLVMSLRAQSHANALQQQVAAYEQQLDTALQIIQTNSSPAPVLSEISTPEPDGQTEAGQDAAEQSTAQNATSVQTAPKTTARQSTQPKSAAAAPQPTAKPATPPAAKAQPPVQKQEITVYVTKTGDCYHSGDCSHLRQSKVPTTLEAAKAQGYRRCSKCDAPR